MKPSQNKSFLPNRLGNVMFYNHYFPSKPQRHYNHKESVLDQSNTSVKNHVGPVSHVTARVCVSTKCP